MFVLRVREFFHLIWVICSAQTTTNMDEFDELTRMEEQLEATTVVNMQNIPNDEESVMRRAQEESLRQYRYEEQMRAGMLSSFFFSKSCFGIPI